MTVAGPAVYTEPGLRAGWEPDTPAEDTLLRRYLLNLAESNLAPVRALGGRTLLRDDVAAADLARPTGLLLNAAVLLRPLGAGRAGEVLDALDAFYGAGGTGAVSLFSAWPTPDLRHRGWRLEGHPPLLFRPPAAPPPDQGGGPWIAAVDGPERLEDWCRVVVDGFPFPELQPYRAGSLLDARVLAERRLRLWVGYEDTGYEDTGADDPGAAVCAGSLFVAYGLAQLWLAATLPEARGRGCYRAMARHRLATVPDLPLAALFSDMSRPAAERVFGFFPLTRFTVWTRDRP